MCVVASTAMEGRFISGPERRRVFAFPPGEGSRDTAADDRDRLLKDLATNVTDPTPAEVTG